MIGELSRRRSVGPRARRRPRQMVATRKEEPLREGLNAPPLPDVRRPRLADLVQSSVLLQLVLAMGFVALAALLYLAQASQVSVLEVNIADLQAHQVQLSAQYASLEASATSLQSLQRVEHLATAQLHMVRPDLSSAVWVQPVIPHIAPLRPLNADTGQGAERASQPLAWIRHLGHLIQTAL